MGDRYSCTLWVRISRFLGALASDEEGQAVTEYLLILSAVVGTSLALSRNIMKGINQGILSLGATLEKDLKTGRANVGLWKN